MRIAIVKYNAGNVQSVRFALQRLGVQPELTDDPESLNSADRVIFPGVGEASSAMRYLQARGLDRVIASLEQPVLGVCLGLQLLCEHSEEGDTRCMGVFSHRVRRFGSSAEFESPASSEKKPDRSVSSESDLSRHGAALKVPQIGWNTIGHDGRGIFDGLEPEPYVYFVHGYYAELGPDTVAKTVYGLEFSSALRRDNFSAVQFHPEKSAGPGARILENFLGDMPGAG